jgi:hypothetical protein
MLRRADRTIPKGETPLMSTRRAGLVRIVCIAVACVAGLGAASAEPDRPLPDGTKTITLVSDGGERVAIGEVAFQRDGREAAFEIKLDASKFQDEFLSMRPFSCLPDTKQMWCHLAYPYDLKRRISTDDLVDLEYSLLFLFKPPTGYGIDPWNGLYFAMTLTDDGAITGTLHDVNLDPLGTPPADRSARTIQPHELTKSDPASRRFARVEIR